MKVSALDLWKTYIPSISTISLEKGISWEPTWKSTPVSTSYIKAHVKNASDYGLLPECKSCHPVPENIFMNLKHELAGFIWNVNKIHSLPDGFFSPGVLWSHRVLAPFEFRLNTMWANDDLDYFERAVGPQLSTLLGAYKEVPLVTGRLCQVIEGGGKRRLFAICNYVKQRLLSPVHSWAFKVLSRLPSDGTFDQEGPLSRLREQFKRSPRDVVYSFDLKSATDRWPLCVIYTMFETLFGPTLASSVVNSSLGLNTFFVGPPLTKKEYEVSFMVGQPLGYKGSWSLFSLSHHFVVWIAAKRAYPARTTPFWDYALLGDDIVIADERVAHAYREILSQLGVSISLPKSILSTNGTCEFAKRYWTKSLQKDLSPISLRALAGCRSIRGLVQIAGKYGIEDPKILQRLGGAGYRVRSRLLSTQSRKWERLKVAHAKPFGSKQLPLEFWLGRGKPLNPYLKGRMVAFLRRELKPKEIQIFPQDLVFDGEREILERTVLLGWVRQWLKLVSWYHTKALSPDVSIDELLDGPVFTRTWKRSEVDENLIRFGLVWKLYDMGAGWNLSTTPQYVLSPDTVILYDRWILGGISGRDFMMAPVV